MSKYNMATSTKKKFTIPSLSEMGNDGSSKIDKGFSTFKSRQEADTANASNMVQKVESVSHVSSIQQKTAENNSNTGKEMTPSTNLQSSLDKHVENEKEKPKTTDSEAFPTLAKLGTTNSVIVNPRQRGNPILKHIRNIPWEYGNIIPDYVMGQATCALFLSLRYHQLHPNYIHDRLKSLGRSFDLRVLLVQVDLADPHHLLKDLSNICILADCTLMLAFTAEEAGRYLETYKIYENKSPEAIMEKSDSNFMTKLTDCFTTVKSVNKTDCNTLISSFKTIENIMNADKEDMGLCPGFGPQKAKRLYDLLHEPFIKYKKQPSNRPNLDTDQQESSSSKVT